MKLSLEQKVHIPSNWSITKQREQVTIKKINFDEWTVEIQYSSGYQETMPISSLEEGL